MLQISQSGKTNWNIIDTVVNSNHPFLPLYVTWYYETQSSANNIKGWLKLLASSNSVLGFRKSWTAKNGKRRRFCLLIWTTWWPHLTLQVLNKYWENTTHPVYFRCINSQRKCRIRKCYFCNTWRHWDSSSEEIFVMVLPWSMHL